MIFEQKALAFEILDVFRVRQRNTRADTPGRPFDALSFRIDADTDIVTDKRHLHLAPNAVCFFPAEVSYTRKTAVDDLIVVHFHAIGYNATEPEHFYPSEPATMAALFEEMLHCWQGKAPGYRHEASALLYRVLAACYRDNEPTLGGDERIEAGVRYIKERCLHADFSLAEAAGRSFMSEAYFRRLFHRQMGESPKQYVTHRRLKHAATLLQTDYYSVAEVAALCGYRDSKHFSVEFKRAMGASPSAYAYQRNITPKTGAKKQ